ncbi:MAG: chromosomal replication initiator protein DnaA [Oscillospiraceae bacterium]|jgi:chromosomal replication initiator protein|nr:chromosomal replication initiator protein DnaA [Oscillospiraceae bacterium]
MNDAMIWEKACELMRDEMNEVSYNTWISGSLRFKGVRDGVFYLEVLNVFMRGNILRYATLIRNALSQAAGRQASMELMTAEELLGVFPPEGEKGALLPSALNEGYKFDTFVVGNSNRFAHAAALAVAEAPAMSYNPLFIYGGVGLGKTHLMHAIGHHLRENIPGMNLLYISSENFTNELITAIQRNKNAEFRDRFRNVDVLMVDDIQFIAGRDSTQEEFFHTFNTLHTAGKQIVISSDKPPKEIMRLEDRLVSRFEWGLVADIQKPDFDTRLAILRRKADTERELLPIEDEVLTLIAGRIDSNIRELEGCLTRVVAYASLIGKPAVTRAVAEEALRDMLAIKDPKRITCEVVQQVVADYFGLSLSDLREQRRSRQVSVPRQVAMYLTREMTEMSLTQIGAAFSRDHSTVLHACEKVTADAKKDFALHSQLEDLRRAVKSK